MTSQAQYEAFIAAIDTSIAGSDEYGDLRWHVACSAEANAGDMMAEGNEDFYAAALATAEMCLDDWKSYYPQLVK